MIVFVGENWAVTVTAHVSVMIPLQPRTIKNMTVNYGASYPKHAVARKTITRLECRQIWNKSSFE